MRRAAACIGTWAAALPSAAAGTDAEAGATPTAVDPILALCLAIGVAALFGSPSRAGRPRGGVLGALAAIAVSWALGAPLAAVAIAAALGGAVAFAAPAQGPRPRASWDAGARGSAVARW